MYFSFIPNIQYDSKPIQYPFSESDFVVAKNSSVSSEHGIITFKNNHITIQDHKSRNGIAINIKTNRLMKGK